MEQVRLTHREMRALKRAAKAAVKSAGFTREALQKHLAQITKPKPRWCPRWLWAKLLDLVVAPPPPHAR